MKKQIVITVALSLLGSLAQPVFAAPRGKKDSDKESLTTPSSAKSSSSSPTKSKPNAALRLAQRYGKKYGLSKDEQLEQAEKIEEAVARTRGSAHEGFEVPEKYAFKFKTLGIPASSKRKSIVMRSTQPSPENLVELAMAAQKVGIDPSEVAVLNFRAENNVESTYHRDFANASDSDERAAGKITMVEKPTLDHTIFRYHQVVEVLNMLTDPKYKLVLMHCKVGKARTGQMVAIMRIVLDGWSVEDALSEAKDRGLRRPLQIAFVRQFAADWKAGRVKLNEKT